jgi:hypothetical protein
MSKKNDKRLCWNCEGNVSHHLSQCPYCGVDLTQPKEREESNVFQGFGSPFQSAPDQNIPQPPYARTQTKDFIVTEEEWNTTLNQGKEESKEEDTAPTTKREIIAFLLIMPGIVFFLFALALIFFSNKGVLTLQWNQNVAYFYFLGAIPLIYLGWRALR